VAIAVARHSRAVARTAAHRVDNGVTKDEIVELFIHLKAYVVAARAFDS
jgi:alkylhydroperoxidase/carboxymuconolactone decarboxylase family protein YurZ